MIHNTNKRIALVHDYIKEYGGAERVLETLHEMYPDADVFTSIYSPKYLGPHRKRFENWKIKTSMLQYVPFKEKLISPFRLISPWAFSKFDFSKYDLIIVSATGAYFPNCIKKSSAKHICYCHTPPRYLYGYKTARDWEGNVIFKMIGHIVNHFLRMVDFNSAQNVDLFIANSQEVKRRIEKFYRKEAEVVYPPVDTPSIKYYVSSIKEKAKSEVHDRKYIIRNTGYFLAGGRLARAKRFDLAVEACMNLDLPLKIFGKSFAGYGEELKKKSSDYGRQSRVEFLGEVSEEDKYKLMADAKAFIFPSEDEDFGITPVEAMSVGTPVIAYNSGGVKETVIDGKTGVFFDELSVNSLVKAIKRFNKIKINSQDCKNRAKMFSKNEFISEIQRTIDF